MQPSLGKRSYTNPDKGFLKKMSSFSETFSIDNDELELLRVREHLYDEVVEFYRENLLENEPVYIAMNFSSSDLAITEACEAVKLVLKDEVSFVLRKRATKELVAIRMNRLLTEESNKNSAFTLKSPAMIGKSEFVKRLKNSFNIFEQWNIDCVFDLSGVCVRNELCRKGLGSLLTKHSIEFARQMLNETLKEKITLPSHVRDLKPKAITCIYSSYFSQSMAIKLGMETLVRVPYTEFIYQGKPIADNLDPIHAEAKFMAMRL